MNQIDGLRLDSVWADAGGETLADAVPDTLRQALGENGETLSSGTVPPETLLKTLDGRSVLSLLGDALRGQEMTVVRSLGLLCGLLLLSSVWKLWRREREGGGTGEVFSVLCTAVMTLTVFGFLERQMDAVASVQAQIHSAMTAAVTTVTCLSAMRGGVVQASVMRAGMGLFLAFAEVVCGGLLLPFVRLCGGMTIASVLGGGLKLDGVSSFLRKTFLFLTGALMMLLTAVLSCQRVLAKSADSVSLRAVKFALGSAVPVIGSAVGEAASAVGAGFSLLEKSAGMLGIVIVLWQVLPPLLTVYLGKLVFSVSAAFGEILELSEESALCREAEALSGFLCAVLTAECVLYLLLLSLCMGGAA